jgi:hypothetical protein
MRQLPEGEEQVMKRKVMPVFVVAAVLAMSIATAAAIAAPAPKTTGGIGYTVLDPNLQRHLSFNAIQSTTNTCGTFWDVTTVTGFSFVYPGGPYVHTANLTQNGQSVGGSGFYTGIPTNTWDVNPGSTVVGNTLTLTWNYTSPPGLVTPTQYVLSMVGNINPITGAITGNWSQTGGASGTFTALGSATAEVTYCGKGHAYYSDANGTWYFVNVTAVSVDGDDAWFAGPVIAGNVGFVGSWLFVKVYDGGEPGKLVDKIWGEVTTESAALAGVALHGTPVPYGAITITSGNIQVH